MGQQGIPEHFWRDLAAADSRLLVLDYDGTLAPFTVDRDRAWPYKGVRELLEQIIAAGHTRVVLITGRDVEALLSLLRLSPAPEIWGSHGHQRRLADGTVQPVSLSIEQQRAIAAAEAAARCIGDASAVETKTACVAFHWRGSDPASATAYERQLREAWEPLTANDFAIHNFDGGLEFRYTGSNKGSAINTLLAELGKMPITAFLGDDLTDEDAFAALKGRGLTVLVRPEHRETQAVYWIRPPEGLIEFLEKWHSAGVQAT